MYVAEFRTMITIQWRAPMKGTVPYFCHKRMDGGIFHRSATERILVVILTDFSKSGMTMCFKEVQPSKKRPPMLLQPEGWCFPKKRNLQRPRAQWLSPNQEWYWMLECWNFSKIWSSLKAITIPDWIRNADAFQRSATCKGTSTNQSHRIGNGNFHQLMAIAEGSAGNSSHGVREVNQAKLLCVDIVSCCSFHFVSSVFQSQHVEPEVTVIYNMTLTSDLACRSDSLSVWASCRQPVSFCTSTLLWGFSAQWDHHHKTSHALQLLHALDTCHFKDDDSTCQSAHCQFMVATAPSIGPWPLGHGFYRIGDSDRGHLAGLLMSSGLQLGCLPEAATEIHQFFAMFFLLHVWESRRRTCIIANETKVERPTLVIFENGKAYSWWLKFWTWALNAGFLSSLWYSNMMEQHATKTKRTNSGKCLAPKTKPAWTPPFLANYVTVLYMRISILKNAPYKVHPLYQRSYFRFDSNKRKNLPSQLRSWNSTIPNAIQ